MKEFPNGGALLRIEPVKAGRDDATYECVAENGVGDAVNAEATLVVFEGKFYVQFFVLETYCDHWCYYKSSSEVKYQ